MMIWNNPGTGMIIMWLLFLTAIAWEFWGGDGD